jgi:crotonobetainyl-CoA:carnitine CoA-transferase CaiB-like acyl-CoA transferase
VSGPLNHIKVVEMALAIQGPAAGLYLRDMGADESINPKWDRPIKRFSQGVTRQDAEEIQKKMAAAFKSKTTPEWVVFLGGQPDIVYEKVQNYDEVRVDAQALANNYIESMELAHVGKTSIVGNLMTFSETPSSTRGGPSDLGADTEATLTALGFSGDEIKSVVDHADAERAITMEQLGT